MIASNMRPAIAAICAVSGAPKSGARGVRPSLRASVCHWGIDDPGPRPRTPPSRLDIPPSRCDPRRALGEPHLVFFLGASASSSESERTSSTLPVVISLIATLRMSQNQ